MIQEIGSVDVHKSVQNVKASQWSYSVWYIHNFPVNIIHLLFTFIIAYNLFFSTSVPTLKKTHDLYAFM